jgi:hypothetical protein
METERMLEYDRKQEIERTAQMQKLRRMLNKHCDVLRYSRTSYTQITEFVTMQRDIMGRLYFDLKEFTERVWIQHVAQKPQLQIATISTGAQLFDWVKKICIEKRQRIQSIERSLESHSMLLEFCVDTADPNAHKHAEILKELYGLREQLFDDIEDNIVTQKRIVHDCKCVFSQINQVDDTPSYGMQKQIAKMQEESTEFYDLMRSSELSPVIISHDSPAGDPVPPPASSPAITPPHVSRYVKIRYSPSKHLPPHHLTVDDEGTSPLMKNVPKSTNSSTRTAPHSTYTPTAASTTTSNKQQAEDITNSPFVGATITTSTPPLHLLHKTTATDNNAIPPTPAVRSSNAMVIAAQSPQTTTTTTPIPHIPKDEDEDNTSPKHTTTIITRNSSSSEVRALKDTTNIESPHHHHTPSSSSSPLYTPLVTRTVKVKTGEGHKPQAASAHTSAAPAVFTRIEDIDTADDDTVIEHKAGITTTEPQSLVATTTAAKTTTTTAPQQTAMPVDVSSWFTDDSATVVAAHFTTPHLLSYLDEFFTSPSVCDDISNRTLPSCDDHQVAASADRSPSPTMQHNSTTTTTTPHSQHETINNEDEVTFDDRPLLSFVRRRRRKSSSVIAAYQMNASPHTFDATEFVVLGRSLV